MKHLPREIIIWSGGSPSKCERIQTGVGECRHINANVCILHLNFFN